MGKSRAAWWLAAGLASLLWGCVGRPREDGSDEARIRTAAASDVTREALGPVVSWELRSTADRVAIDAWPGVGDPLATIHIAIEPGEKPAVRSVELQLSPEVLGRLPTDRPPLPIVLAAALRDFGVARAPSTGAGLVDTMAEVGAGQ
jgi:hypothetical protein